MKQEHKNGLLVLVHLNVYVSRLFVAKSDS